MSGPKMDALNTNQMGKYIQFHSILVFLPYSCKPIWVVTFVCVFEVFQLFDCGYFQGVFLGIFFSLSLFFGVMYILRLYLTGLIVLGMGSVLDVSFLSVYMCFFNIVYLCIRLLQQNIFHGKFDHCASSYFLISGCSILIIIYCIQIIIIYIYHTVSSLNASLNNAG